MPTPQLRVTLARDGIFNTRDLGGTPTRSGHVVAHGRIIRADALQRLRGATVEMRRYGVVRVLDLRDEREREADGVLMAEGIEVQHHPVLDPTFAWSGDADPEVSQLLIRRYQDILGAFGPRLAGAITSIAEVVSDDGTGGAVAYHCAVGKDRTGLLSALLLALLDVEPAHIAEDYARSSRATAVQVNWLWSFGLPGGTATDEDLQLGVWSARPETMLTTLDWIEAEFGGVDGYLRTQGLAPEVVDSLRRGVLTDAPT